MPGLTDWFDVFRCGTHRDHSGTLRTITEGDIDRAIKSYRCDSAPVVVGHPTLNAPAFGWVKDFRRVGPTVQARCSRVVPEFIDAVKRGLYKNRSLSFNHDGSFRHVGFLGAAAPAVKGLEEIQFSDSGDFVTMDFNENESVTTETHAAADPAAEAVVEDAEPAKGAEAPAITPGKAAAAEPPAQQLQADVKSTIDELNRKVKELEGKLNNEQAKRRRMEFAAYTDGLINSGRLKAAAKEPVIDTLEALHAQDVASFADSENNHLNRFKELLNSILPEKRVEFVEFAAPHMVAHQHLLPVNDGSHHHGRSPEEIAALARKMVDQNRISGFYMTASEAVNKVLGGEADA